MSTSQEQDKKLFYSTMVTPECYEGEFELKYKDAWKNIDKFDFQKAFEQFKSLANDGDRDAQLNLAVFYEGYPPVEDNVRAKNYYKLAAEKNSARAIAYIAEEYCDLGFYDKAIEMYTSILSDNHYSYYGYFGLAQMYEYGYGVENDLSKAISLMKSAADNEPLYYLSPGRAYMLLGFYYYLVGNDKEEKEALDKSIKLNIKNLFTIYEFYSDKDSKRAMQWGILATGSLSENQAIKVHSDSNNEYSEQVKKNGGRNSPFCFIATEVYQNIDAPEVDILRKFRDETLYKYKTGEYFIDLYYLYSPKVATFISYNSYLRLPIRVLILNPLTHMISMIKKY